jgi:hypothetical protein
MKMYEILELPKLYNSIKNTKLSIKVTYKFTRLMRRAEEELNFYQEKFQEILEEYGAKEDGHFKMSPDGLSVAIISGKEEECNEKISELRNLEIPFNDISFSIDELEGIDISISELSCLMSLIKD